MRKYLVLFVWAIISVHALDSDITQQWKKFKNEHKLTFEDSIEDSFRFKIFRDNIQKIAKHNKKYEEGKTTYWMAVNKFSHLLSTEFAEKMLMRTTSEREKQVENNKSTPIVAEVPETMDWRTKGAVTPVKDQAACGSCWAFSATGAVESMQFIKKGKMVTLSEKNLMDCTWSYGNHGCGGGNKFDAFQYIIDNNGVDTEESYPYVDEDGDCLFSRENVGATLSAYKKTIKGDEEDLKRAIGSIAPMAVSIYVLDAFHHYAGGVYTDDECPNTSSNHAVLAVGYGHDDAAGLDYWLVKNSWGADWGEEGYIRMARNVNNICGIATKAGYPVI